MLELNYIQNGKEYSIKGMTAFLKLLSWQYSKSEMRYSISVDDVEYLCIRNGVFSSFFVELSSTYKNAILVLDHCEFRNNSQNKEKFLMIQKLNVQFDSVIFQGEWDVSFSECKDIDLNLTETQDEVSISCSRCPSGKVKIQGNGKNYSLNCHGTSNLEIQGVDYLFVSSLEDVQNLKAENSVIEFDECGILKNGEIEYKSFGGIKNSVVLNHSVLTCDNLDFSSLQSLVLNDSQVIGKKVSFKDQRFFPANSSEEIVISDGKDSQITYSRESVLNMNEKIQLISILKGLYQALEQQIEQNREDILFEREMEINELRERLQREELKLEQLGKNLEYGLPKQTVRKLTNKKKG